VQTFKGAERGLGFCAVEADAVLQLASEYKVEVKLTAVLAGDGALVGPGTGLAFVVDVEPGFVVDVEVQVNFR
jgi:hypothetical protein